MECLYRVYIIYKYIIKTISIIAVSISALKLCSGIWILLCICCKFCIISNLYLFPLVWRFGFVSLHIDNFIGIVLTSLSSSWVFIFNGCFLYISLHTSIASFVVKLHSFVKSLLHSLAFVYCLHYWFYYRLLSRNHQYLSYIYLYLI